MGQSLNVGSRLSVTPTRGDVFSYPAPKSSFAAFDEIVLTQYKHQHDL
jgi:hypothetical protein